MFFFLSVLPFCPDHVLSLCHSCAVRVMQWLAELCCVIYINTRDWMRRSNRRSLLMAERNREWEWLSCEWPAVFTLSQTKTILSGIISIVSDLRNVFLKCLVSLTTMKSRDIPFWAWSGQRIMIQFICSLSLMTVLYFLVEYWGREYDQSGSQSLWKNNEFLVK